MGYILSGDAQLFQPDTMLPSQYFAAMRKKIPQEAEYRLVVAVLEDAIDCYQKHCNAHDPKARELFDDAARWIASEDRTWPFSFINVCELLNMNAVYVRQGLQTWKERHAPTWTHPKVVALKSAQPVAVSRRDVTARAS